MSSPTIERMHRANSIAALLVVVALAACSPTPSASPATPTGRASNPAPTSAATVTATAPGASVTLPTQTDTEWGRIWDALPSSFPEPPNAQPATDTGDGPSSAQLIVTGARGGIVREQVVQFYLDALAGAGYAVNRDGPLEDGGITISASKGGGCQVQASIKPIDSGVIVTVLYGASCAFE